MTDYGGDIHKFAEKLKETLKVKEVILEGSTQGCMVKVHMLLTLPYLYSHLFLRFRATTPANSRLKIYV